MKPDGWGIAAETYLATVRLLMNPQVLRSGRLCARQAIEAVEAELAGEHRGRILLARRAPNPRFLVRATGHRQVMDFWLVQIAADYGCKLATNDAALAASWPEIVERAS